MDPLTHSPAPSGGEGVELGTMERGEHSDGAYGGASYFPLMNPKVEGELIEDGGGVALINDGDEQVTVGGKDVGLGMRIREYLSVPQEHRANLLCLVLTGFFFVNTATAELISGKLFVVGPFTVSIGSLMWPFVFITTDVTNEYFGKRMVRQLSVLMAVFLGYMYALLMITIRIPASNISPVKQSDYQNVFGQSNWIIVGSLIAFLVGQLIDISVYHFMRTRTKGKHLWLRSTGSTVISQLVDSFVVSGIAFLLPGKITFLEYLNLAGVAYIYKFIVALMMTPAVYGLHHALDKFLGSELATQMLSKASS